MKRSIAMTLVLFLLSLGSFTAVTAWMCRTQEQVEFTNIVARGGRIRGPGAAHDGV